MGRLGNYFKENLDSWKEKVEKKLEVELGDINVLPMPEYIHELLGNDKKWTSFERILLKINMLLNEPKMTAKAGNNTIYYSRNPIDLLYSKNSMTETGIHELVHIVHSRLVGKPLYSFKCDSRIEEGFADYITRDIKKELGYSTDIMAPERGLNFFEELIKKRNINSREGLVELLKEYSN